MNRGKLQVLYNLQYVLDLKIVTSFLDVLFCLSVRWSKTLYLFRKVHIMFFISLGGEILQNRQCNRVVLSEITYNVHIQILYSHCSLVKYVKHSLEEKLSEKTLKYYRGHFKNGKLHFVPKSLVNVHGLHSGYHVH